VDGSGAPASDSYNGRYAVWQGQDDGPWETVNHAASLIQAGDTCWVRSATYSAGVEIATGHSGTAAQRITIKGDWRGEIWPDSSSRPLLDGDYYSSYNCFLIQNDYWTVEDFEARRASKSGFSLAAGVKGVQVINCVSHNHFNNGFRYNTAALDPFFADCVAYDNNLSGFFFICNNHLGHPSTACRCIAYDNTLDGLTLTVYKESTTIPSPVRVESCLFYENGYAGIRGLWHRESHSSPPGTWNALTVVNTTICDNGSCGFFNEMTDTETWIYNSIITNNTGEYGVTHYGLYDDSQRLIATGFNCLTENEHNWGGYASPGPGSSTDDPLYVDRSGDDYHIKNTSPCPRRLFPCLEFPDFI
jgi:hypothetical protein